MKTLTTEEIDSLNMIKQDIEITLESNFSESGNVFVKNLTSLTSIFVALYFKILNHNPESINWKNRDRVFATNNFSNIVKNVTKVHAGYTSFDLLKAYLDDNRFDKIENSISEAIGHYIVGRDRGDNHPRYYYIIMSELDVFNNLSSLEYIVKNNIRRMIIILYTRNENQEINEENRLNGRLIGLGFDTLVISAEKPEYICDAVSYAKNLDKPSIILANIN